MVTPFGDATIIRLLLKFKEDIPPSLGCSPGHPTGRLYDLILWCRGTKGDRQYNLNEATGYNFRFTGPNAW